MIKMPTIYQRFLIYAAAIVASYFITWLLAFIAVAMLEFLMDPLTDKENL
jgi:hypothetical protein